MTTPTLTPLQLRFAEEYALDPTNATGAARRAGYSQSAASGIAQTLKNDPRVLAKVEDITGKAVRRVGIDKERILQELALIAFSSPDQVISSDDEGNPDINLHGLSRDTSGATEVTVNTTTADGKKKIKSINIKTVKMADKVAALVKLGQHVGMFKEQTDVNVNLTLAQLVEQSMNKPLSVTPIDGEITEVTETPLLEESV